MKNSKPAYKGGFEQWIMDNRKKTDIPNEKIQRLIPIYEKHHGPVEYKGKEGFDQWIKDKRKIIAIPDEKVERLTPIYERYYGPIGEISEETPEEIITTTETEYNGDETETHETTETEYETEEIRVEPVSEEDNKEIFYLPASQEQIETEPTGDEAREPSEPYDYNAENVERLIKYAQSISESIKNKTDLEINRESQPQETEPAEYTEKEETKPVADNSNAKQEFIDTMQNIIKSAKEKEDYSTAIEDYKQLLSASQEIFRGIKPKNRAYIYRNLGNLFFKRGREEKNIEDVETALTHYDTAQDFNPKNKKTARNIEIASKLRKEIKDDLAKTEPEIEGEEDWSKKGNISDTVYME